MRGLLVCAMAALGLIPAAWAGDAPVVKFSVAEKQLQIEYSCREVDWERSVFVALQNDSEMGSAVIPFSENFEGSTVFLPFQASKLYILQMGTDTARVWQRTWKNWKWIERQEAAKEVELNVGAYDCAVRLPLTSLGKKIKVVIYSKVFSPTQSWGRLFGSPDPLVRPGEGDRYIPHYFEVDLSAKDAPAVKVRGRLGQDITRPRIYQLFVRLFGNLNTTRTPNGTMAVNGVGKFNDINDAALSSLKTLGFTHIWFTGVLQQATGTDYPEIGQPADDADLLKGIAGSPYAIKDYFDVCPDYAVEPKARLTEFKSLLTRIHSQKLKALIDFVPNHVARCYRSDIKRR
jgi:hypothetical protein